MAYGLWVCEMRELVKERAMSSRVTDSLWNLLQFLLYRFADGKGSVVVRLFQF